MIISDGLTNTTGFDNNCEDDENYTKWYVLHAEANALTKVSSSTQSSEEDLCYFITMEIAALFSSRNY